MKNDVQDWFEMVERLRRADTVWSTAKLPVELRQTHISVILMGESQVLKLKKPVNFGFLDYSSLEQRRIACEREVELNRRLCPEIYLGVRTIVEDEQGIRLSDDGKVVDYAVWMERLPEARMLDRLALDNTLTEADIARIAKLVHTFHKSALRSEEIDALGGIKTIRYNWDENFEQAEPYIGRTVTRTDFDKIREWVYSWLDENEELLNRRVTEGHVCDGHGDLRCESVCVTNGIRIFDCIEFNDRFRCADVANEVAFLSMDLDAFGRPDLGYYFYECYAEESEDEDIFKLFSFYRCYRAFVRGKVLSFQLDEAEMTDKQKRAAERKARDYFTIAARSAERRLQTPAMIVVSGPSGTGKTSVARALAGELGSRVVSSDKVRRALFGEVEGPTRYGEGRYDEESNRLTYQKMIEMGLEFLKKDGVVILDATFRRSADREMARSNADSAGASWRLIECSLEPEKVRERLDLRAKRREGFSKATWETYKMQRAEDTDIGTKTAAHLLLDTDGSLSAASRRAVDWLRTDLAQAQHP